MNGVDEQGWHYAKASTTNRGVSYYYNVLYQGRNEQQEEIDTVICKLHNNNLNDSFDSTLQLQLNFFIVSLTDNRNATLFRYVVNTDLSQSHSLDLPELPNTFISDLHFFLFALRHTINNFKYFFFLMVVLILRCVILVSSFKLVKISNQWTSFHGL